MGDQGSWAAKPKTDPKKSDSSTPSASPAFYVFWIQYFNKDLDKYFLKPRIVYDFRN